MATVVRIARPLPPCWYSTSRSPAALMPVCNHRRLSLEAIQAGRAFSLGWCSGTRRPPAAGTEGWHSALRMGGDGRLPNQTRQSVTRTTRARRCSAVAVGALEQSGGLDDLAISPPESDAAPASADEAPRVKSRNGQPPRVAIFIEPSPFSHVSACRRCPCTWLSGQPWTFGVRLLPYRIIRDAQLDTDQRRPLPSATPHQGGFCFMAMLLGNCG